MPSEHGDQVLSYLEFLISRHSDEIQELLLTKPKPISALERERFCIRDLLDLKNAYLSRDQSRATDIARLQEESDIFSS